MRVALLLTRVRVDEDHRLVCQAPGCGKGIYADVHVIRDETGAVRVIGSECYLKLSGHLEATKQGASIGSWDGRRLTLEERDAMLANTEAFVARMEAEFAAEEAARKVEEERSAAELRAVEEREAEERRAAAERRQRQHVPPASHAGGSWRRPVGPAGSDPLSRFRAQEAMRAARQAVARHPQLAVVPLAEVAQTMAFAKERCLARGMRLDAEGSREAIEQEAVVMLFGPTVDGGHTQ